LGTIFHQYDTNNNKTGKYPVRIMAILLLAVILLSGLARGATAQTGAFTVTITEIDSRAFPQVTVYVTVLDENGLPVTGLTVADFALFEDSLPVAASEMTVESVAIKGRNLVLAADLSTYNEVLPQVQAAAKTFVNQLQPEDRLTVVAFYDEIKPLTDFTNNAEVLRSAIDSLTPTGNYTALNEMVLEAARVVESSPAGRKALIILPDCKNNIGPVSPDQAINQVQTSTTPLYLIGVKTKKIQADDLAAFASQTTGLTTVVEPGELERVLGQIANQLPHGYRITFRSQLKADNQTHGLLVTTNQDGKTGQAEGNFVATSNPITVILPNLSEGQTVGGLVNLTAEVRTPAPPATIEYLIDGQSLAEVTSPLYAVTWDSTQVEPGEHTLTVKAVDQANNQGQAEVRLNVVPAVVVTISTAQTEVASGEDIAIRAKIEAFHPLARVDLLVDKNLVSSTDTPPYTFSFENSKYSVGRHVITVRATDNQEFTGEDSLTMEFLPAWQVWLRNLLGIEDRAAFEEWLASAQKIAVVIGALAIILLLIFIALLLIGRIVKAQQAYGRQKYGFAILNSGNIRSRYELWAEESSGSLEFGFFLKGADLQEQTTEVVEPAAGVDSPKMTQVAEPAQSVQVTVAPAEEVPSPAATDQTTQAETGKQKSSPGAQMGQTADQARRVMGLSGAIGGILMTVARILPRSMGRPLQNAATRMRAGQTRVQQTMRAPTRIARTTGTVKGQVTKLAPSGSKSQPRAAITPAETETSTGPTATQTSPAPAATQMYQPAAATQVYTAQPTTAPANGRETITKTVTVRLERAQTPFIEPGKTLIVDLHINPIDPKQTGAYTFDVVSRPVEQEDSIPVIEPGSVRITRPFWLLRFLPIFLIMLITAFMILGVGLLTLWLLGIDFMGFYVWAWCTVESIFSGATC
jgi:VWFA-related protein